MTQLYMENNDTISIKVTLFIIKEVFMNLFYRNLKSLFLKEDVISTKYAIKDKNILKQKSNLIEEIKWPILVNLSE